MTTSLPPLELLGLVAVPLGLVMGGVWLTVAWAQRRGPPASPLEHPSDR